LVVALKNIGVAPIIVEEVEDWKTFRTLDERVTTAESGEGKCFSMRP